MRARPGIECCPHCGTRSGFVTNVVFSAERSYTWDNQDVDTDNYSLRRETSPRCVDCGRSVRALVEPAS